jgi:glycosyltransferase involved in cell wall biosynthesis
MRILLIAYDYPPLSSPQAIRWYYLSRELARRGVEMHVLAPDLPARDGNSLDVPVGVTVHRCSAGGLAGWRARREYAHRREGGAVPATDVPHAGPTGLNWKGRLYQWLERFIGRWVYPDSRGLWRISARLALEALIDTLRPDVLISSHEPAVTLQLGLQVAERVPAWLADLGDPVLAGYTPRHWRRRAGELEAAVCRVATGISVATDATRELLMARHGTAASKMFVLSQGFDDTCPPDTAPDVPPAGHARAGELHLLYTGRFYPFRDPIALFDAVLGLESIRLTVAAPELKPEYLAYAERSAGRIVFLGEQPHAKVLELQRRCDVLVNIGNAMNAQIPGKLFEYLGSGKPILHCQNTDVDPVAGLMAQWQRGWSCRYDRASMQALLTALLDSPQRVVDAATGDGAAIAHYGWSRLAADLHVRCQRMMAQAVQFDRPV